MKVSYEYDLDPRYGWASIDLEGATTGMIMVHSREGSLGFNYHDGRIIPVCTCSAWNESECGCSHLEPDYWKD